MENVTVNGMVISAMPIGEYDRRLEVLTAEAGRISIFARGARKPASPFVSVSRVFAFGSFRLFRGKNSYTLESAKITNYFTEMEGDIERNCYGSYFLELARYYIHENMPAADTLNLIYLALKALISPQFDNRLVRAIVELKMLQLNGIQPEAFRCVSCKGTEGLTLFSIPKRGCVCRACQDQVPGASNVGEPCIYAIQYVLYNPIGKLFRFDLKENALVEFARITAHLTEQAADVRFKSLELLEILQKS